MLVSLCICVRIFEFAGMFFLSLQSAQCERTKREEKVKIKIEKDRRREREKAKRARYNAHAFSSTVEIMIIIECLHLQIHSIFIENRFTNGIRRKIGYYSGKKQTYRYIYILYRVCSSSKQPTLDYEATKKRLYSNTTTGIYCVRFENVSSLLFALCSLHHFNETTTMENENNVHIVYSRRRIIFYRMR